MAEQRRLAAILAADMVGYSRLMEADENGTIARQKAHRAELIDPKISEHNGRIVKTTGDGLLVEFASVVDAVNCAVAIQEEMTEREASVSKDLRIQYRIGINIGDIVVDGDDIFGDGVNVAARIEGLCQPGEVYLSATVYNHVYNKVELFFENLGEQNVKNIIKPIQIYCVKLGISQSEKSKSFQPSSTQDLPSKVDLPFMLRPTLAVLPFQNLSGDPELEFFADGLTEDIITALSLWRSFPVIARNSTFAFKGRSVNVQELSRELDVRYILEGSVRQAGKKIRVAAQLVDTESGHNIWVEKFDRFIEDIFELQDDLTEKIAAIVAPELERIGQSKSTQNFDAWTLVQKGMTLLDQYTKESNLRARQLFKQALKLEPSYSRAYSGIALAYARALMSGYEISRDSTSNKALKAARQAVSLDSSDAYAHNMLGMACLWAGQNENALASYKRAVELNPSYAHARGSLGDMLDRMGKSDEGIALMEEALLLNPDATNLRHFNTFLARACIAARRYEDATEWARKAIHLRSNLAHAHCLMAISLAHLGWNEEAKLALYECKRVQPDFFESAVELVPYEDSDTNEHIKDGLRKAGLSKLE